ncbi:zinc ribbon domain-containing protein [Halococcus sp. IIIV-5B]|uniref:zinc ribbon domain-containing protein n=1 Tax=Halococcus sp. IIIV-5B TaxID=2321230 RepID=UPI000E733E78|nr:zinc ribbon domain-containing protein [Halococcus sp. IIIV-5B]RJT00366.1 zinc ribbon domain-containing protein [Halococcus sp. IIIV-5B]
METRSKKRPWLAAVLGAAVPALGHLYLRRWLRALGWIGLTLLSTVFVPDATLDALLSGGSFAWLDALPLLVVSAFSVFDAYRIAVVDNYLLQLRAGTADGQIAVCPECGRDVDDDLAFCRWCAEPLDEPGSGPTR